MGHVCCPARGSRFTASYPPIEADVPAAPPVTESRRGERDKIVTSLNIAKLQAMQMGELNNMAREVGVENFGTMRKHEVIFHILQKNAERAGVLFSEGVLEVLPEVSASCARKVSITSPAPRTFTFRPRKSAGSIYRLAI